MNASNQTPPAIEQTFEFLCAKYASDGEPRPGDSIAVNLELIEIWAAQLEVSSTKLLNRLALQLARKFNEGELTFEFCNSVANDLWWVSLDRRLAAFPTLLDAVFHAFDAGEFHRKPDKSDDPVSEHTVPMIRAILAERGD